MMSIIWSKQASADFTSFTSLSPYLFSEFGSCIIVGHYRPRLCRHYCQSNNMPRGLGFQAPKTLFDLQSPQSVMNLPLECHLASLEVMSRRSSHQPWPIDDGDGRGSQQVGRAATALRKLSLKSFTNNASCEDWASRPAREEVLEQT